MDKLAGSNVSFIKGSHCIKIIFSYAKGLYRTFSPSFNCHKVCHFLSSTEHVPGPGSFPLPENDTVVRAARQLSGLSSRKNLRSSLSCDRNLSGLARSRTSRPQTGTCVCEPNCSQQVHTHTYVCQADSTSVNNKQTVGFKVTGWCSLLKPVKSH